MIEPTFNELSFYPLCETDDEVESRLHDFVCLLEKLKQYGIKRVNIEELFHQIPLKKDLFLSDVYARGLKSPDSEKKNMALYLAAKLHHPCVRKEIEDSFYGGEDNPVNKCVCKSVKPEKECVGLYVADLTRSFSVGFTQPWLNKYEDKRCRIKIIYVDEKLNKESDVFCMTDVSDENHEMFVELMASQADLPVNVCYDNPKDKINKMPEHHGKKECLEYAEQIAKCPYVRKVLNSIDFLEGEKRFILEFKL